MLEKIEKGHYYHIFNRGINSSVIFPNESNMSYFLNLIEKHLTDKVDIIAFCLMSNHFHLIVKIIEDETMAIQAFSNLFNAYAKAFNKQQNRTGSLFEKHFKRKKITDETYLKNLILYVHKNPQNHKVVKHFEAYKFTSYKGYFLGNDVRTLISKSKSYVLSLFEDLENFELVHQSDLQGFENLAGLENSNTTKPNLQGLKDLAGLKEPPTMKDKFFKYIHELQDTITSKLETVDGKALFKEDIWERPEGGGGRTRVIENGNVFEKGGVNISGVHGKLPDSMQKYFGVEDADFFACGLSLVLHPKNPMVPTVHANWRYFEMYDKNGAIVDQWFGGGQDLTPYYLFEEDAIHFHTVCKTACDKHQPEFYKTYKKRCDEYFYNAHRNEGRGIGGLFFDYCKATETMTMENWYDFVTEVGNSFLESYVPIVENRKDLPFSKTQRDWQEIRRGRYVEFNLVHDKGTLFGLKTNGRIESILMSLPPHVQWVYDHQPEPGSEEEKLIDVLKKPVDWV
ncbi:oxygen-dependent coproporphyrinogen oxidase [Mariniflexile gromovii]|uniref:coproporphyrinogen oxidase n=2 Tax=Mariniflexile gromovii TaxID=362523 RepID=A0ABS4BQD3_9FLAO|nr:oxygen-dependent coproporphyrinogen oxidase [Mariniflexile gromovii]